MVPVAPVWPVSQLVYVVLLPCQDWWRAGQQPCFHHLCTVKKYENV